MQTSECSIYGFELTTGEIIFSLMDTCSNIPGNSGKYFGPFAPIFFEDLLITRAQGNAFGGRGFVSAYDVNTKGLVWRWFSVPPEGGEENWGANEASKGNIATYEGDWGDSNLIAGGTSWGLIALDEAEKRIYLLTGEPANQFDASLRPGPNLFTNSVVALDASTGEMIWYYQVTPHDINNHDPGWKAMLSEVEQEGVQKKVVIAAVKSNFVYVLDAESGNPIYPPVHIGSPNFNTINGNAGNNADMMASQRRYVGEVFCPSQLGGVFAAPAYAYNTIFIPTQNVCATVLEQKLDYKNQTIDGFRYRLLLDLPSNGTIYAVDASNGRLKWERFIPNRIQSAALIVSGGVLYSIDRAGVFYAIDAESGSIISEIPFNAIGSAGAAIGADARGEVKLFIAMGGSQLVGKKSGILVAMGLPSSPETGSSVDYRDVMAIGGFAIAVVSVAYAIRIRRRGSRRN